MPIRRGAKDLGLEVRWRFAFVGPGSAGQATPDAVYVDVGGTLGPGVLDQHQEAEDALSSAELVLRYPGHVYDHLVGPWLAAERAGQDLAGRVWSPCIVTHHQPDFDGLVATWLAMRLVEDGELPACAEALASYANQVDQGRYRVKREEPKSYTHAIHLGYLMLQSAPEGSPPPASEDTLRRGLELLGVALDAVRAARGSEPRSPGDLLPTAPGVGGWRTDGRFAGAAELLEGDRAVYERDVAGCPLEHVALPVAGGPGSVRAPLLVLDTPPSSRLFKYWAYADGHAGFVVPFPSAWGQGAPQGEGDGRTYPRVVIAVNPHWREPGGGLRPDLRGLGYALEQKEAEWRSKGGGDSRIKVPRFGGGYCDNDDPWYDGRHHGYGIVDSPRGGTILPLAEVRRVVTSPFWKVPLAGAAVALIEPVAASVGAAGGARPERPARLSDTLEEWYAGSWERKGPAPGDVPAGFAVERSLVRTFPEDTCNPLHVLQLQTKQAGTAHLEDLREWLDDWRTRHPQTSVCAWLRLGTHFSSPDHAREELRRVGDGSLVELGVSPGDDVVLYNSRAIVVTSHRAQPATEQITLWREVLTYATFLSETLNSFSTRIADAIDKRGHIRAASTIRKRFLQFQVRYYQYDVARDSEQRELFRRVSGLLDLPAHYAEVRSELDRLEQAADRESANHLEWLLFAIGLFSVVEAFFGVPLGDDWTAWLAAGWWRPMALVLAGAGATFAWVKRRPRLEDGRRSAAEDRRLPRAQNGSPDSSGVSGVEPGHAGSVPSPPTTAGSPGSAEVPAPAPGPETKAR